MERMTSRVLSAGKLRGDPVVDEPDYSAWVRLAGWGMVGMGLVIVVFSLFDV